MHLRFCSILLAFVLFFYLTKNHIGAFPLAGNFSAQKKSPTTHDSTTVPDSTLFTKNGIGHVKAYPNPFSLSADNHIIIEFVLENESDVDIQIYTPAGELVRQLKNSYSELAISSPPLHVLWDGTNDQQKKVVFGGYICKILVTPKHGGNQISKTVNIGIRP